MPIRKKVDKLNLSQFNTFIERDNSLLSNGLFDILDFPEKLTAGKNLFKLRMQSGRFVDGSEVYVEIIDFNGNPIYYQPLKYIEKDGTRVIAIYIYPETSPGPATISVAGRISIDRDGNRIPFSKDPTDENFFNIPNVIWSRSLPVAPFASNTSEIIYTKQPKITITEIVQPYRQPVNIFNIFTEITESAATFTMQPRGTVNPVQINTNLNKQISGDNKVNQNATEQTIFQGQLSKGSSNKNVGKQVSVQQQVQSSLDDTSGKQTTSETVSTISSDSKITFTNFPLSKSMEGGTLTIVNPLINVPQGTLLVDGKVLPSSQANESNSSTAGAATLPLSGSYNFTILSVLTKNVAFVAQTSGFKNSNDNTFGAFSIEITSNQSNKSGQASINKNIINNIETSTNITASFIKPSDVTFTENSASFADIIIADTEPETGDVYRIKTLFKPSGFFGDFIDLGDTILEQQNVLVDTASLETNITIGSFFENFGQFESLQEIEKYWSGSVVGGLATSAVTLSYDVDTLIGGVQITTDWSNGGDAFTAQNDDASIFEIQNKYRPIIHSNTTYILRFSIALPPSITNYKSNDPNIPDSRIDIYCNNDITVDSPIKNISLGTAALPINFTDTLQNNNFKDNGLLGTRVGSVLASDIPNLISSVELQFKSLSTEALDLKFVTRRGVFILSDIEILADKETGYTPGFVRLSKRIPTEHLKTPLTFKFQYFDIKGQKADIETFAYGAVFNGGNQYIDGTSNMITGSVFIGNKIGSGIELAGVKSGFMRSVGYQGSIDAASGAGPGGFLIYSGSDALTLGSNTFRGVGVELVGDNDKSHLIFKTEGDGELDIKAEKFFIGTTGSQFISGANSNIEISSSLFHLDPQENLLVIGADAIINADLSANQLFVPAGTNKSNARAYISSSGEAAFIGDGAGNYSVVLDGRSNQVSTIAGLTASAHSLSTNTYIISASNNTSDPVSFISSSAFKVSAGGAITGSSVLLGNKAAGNFLQFQGNTLSVQGNITADNISTPSAAPTPSASISADGFANFVSASIAGFVVNTEEIKSSNEALRLKSSGDITASRVLLSGGTITDSVTILGSVSANSILTPATIGGSPATTANASSSISDQGLAIFRSASIAGFVISPEEIRSPGNALRLKSAGQITASDGFLFGNKGTSNFVQFANNALTVRGDLSVDQIFTPATIGGSPATINNASSSITSQGFAKFVSASIGGWDITTNTIEGGNLLLRQEGIIQTRDFASGFKGFKISAEGNGTAEFENVRIRGTLRTTTFEKESVNAVGGQLWVTNATTISGSNVSATDTTMSVANASGFTVGEILLAKKVDNTGFQTEYLLVQSASFDGDNSNADEVRGKIFVQRAYGSGSQGSFVGDLASTSQSYDEGQVLVSTGLTGSGYIKMNANPRDTATPFMDIVERTGSGLYDVVLKARLGDLSGIANTDRVFGNPNPGFGLATENVFLKGGIRANTGSIAGIEMEAGKLYIGTGNHANSDTGFYVDSGSKFSLGDKLTWDGSALTVQGQLRLSSGQTVDNAINEATASNTAKSLILTTDSQVMTFASASAVDANPNTIIFSIAQQNLSASVSASNIIITTAQGGNVTGFNFDTENITTNTAGLVSGLVSGSLSFTGSLTVGGLNSDKDNFPVTIAASGDGLSDQTTIFKLEGGQTGSAGQDGAAGTDGTDGTDAITAFLTNESHTFPAAADGTVSSFLGGTTDMIVFQGITNVTNNFVISASNGIGVSSSLSTNTVSIGSLANDSGSVKITATSESVSLDKTMSLAKSKTGVSGSDGSDGAAGANAKILTLTTDSQIFSFASASSNVALDNDILFIINQQNLSGTIDASDITISTAGGNVTNFSLDNNSVTSGTGQVSGSITFTGSLSVGGLNSTKTNLPATITVTKDSLTDTTRIFKIDGGTAGVSGSDGAPGADGAAGQPSVNGFLTNESHTFVADQNGNVSSFTEGSSSMFVFVGLTNSTASFSYSRTNSTGVSSTLGGSAGNVLAISAMAHDSGSIDVTATSASISITKTMTLAKSRQGASGSDGADGAPGATGPTGPNFDFLTGSLSEVDTTGGLPKGLLMTSTVFGFHEAILEGDGTNATLGDFSSFLDSTGNFFIGKDTAAHFAFSSASATLLVSGSNVDIQTPKFFLGKKNVQFISGSNGNIEISSSKIHIKPDGDAIVRKVNAEEGTIGGFVLSSDEIRSSNNNLRLKDSGQITGSNVLFSGGDIGGFVLSSDSIKSSNNRLQLKDSGQFTGSFVLLDGGKVGGFDLSTTEISSSGLLLKSSGQITGSNVLLEGGRITSGVTIEGSVTANAIRTPATIGGSPSTDANASSSIDSNGFAKFVSASIGGFVVDTETITGGFVAESSSISSSLVTISFTIPSSTSAGSSTTTVSNIATLSTRASIFDDAYIKPDSANGDEFEVGGVAKATGQISTINLSTGLLTLHSGNVFGSFYGEGAAVNKTFTLYSNSGATVNTFATSSINIDQEEEVPLRLNSVGQITASAALFDGVVRASNFSEKIVTINDGNSGSFLQYVSGDAVTGKKNIVFNGALGGEKMMNCVIDVTAGFTISDIVIDSLSDSFNDVSIIVQTGGMTFDDANVSPLPGDVYTAK